MTKEHSLDRISDILDRHTSGRYGLIPLLQKIQSELGYLPREAMSQVARRLNIYPGEVYSVATFYNQFRLTPPGRHQIKVCLGTACRIKGGKVILDSWERELGIDEGETSADREYSLDHVACVGCCAMAPVSVVDDRVEARVSPTRVKGVLLTFDMEKRKANDENRQE
ncbi:MAG: NAD(P)H-dependent oxidoreductase subunit E [Chloroflexota bacterium]|nr:NAD(P)H-dependent oxidoreductase subunit E [Chloroflexota bacterium]